MSPRSASRNTAPTGSQPAGERPPPIEVLWWEGCPSTERLLPVLRELLDELGLDFEATVRLREVKSDAEAEREKFAGSPTIRVRGREFQESGGPYRLTCRLYRLPDGRPSPLPDRDELKEFIAAELGASTSPHSNGGDDP
ncbi:hypothetical protein HRbin41_01529 [bacterium HR41]|nr:hypothetical protein HRbin41_01529 [bacterium HR41]